MESHIKVVAWLHIVMGGLGVIGAVVLFFIIAGVGAISGDHVAMFVTSTVGMILAGGIILFSIPGFIAGVGLLKLRPWARILTIVLSIFHLFGFPIGTAIGAYCLWVLFNEKTVRLFEAQRQTALAYANPPY